MITQPIDPKTSPYWALESSALIQRLASGLEGPSSAVRRARWCWDQPWGHRRGVRDPYLPLTRVFGFVPLPPSLLGTIVLITIAYVAATELQKRWFYRSRAPVAQKERAG